MRRRNKIDNHWRTGVDERHPLFVTLTYSDAYIPYIMKDDYLDFYEGVRDDIPVYRNNKIWCRQWQMRIGKDSDGNPIYKPAAKVITSGKHVISYINEKTLSTPEYEFTRDDLQNHNLSFLHYKQDGIDCFRDGKIGILFLPDLQNFIKRFSREFNNEFSYAYCTEYGTDWMRPHMHILFYLPNIDYKEKAVRAIRKNWPFCDWRKIGQIRDPIEDARDPSSYISSYISRYQDLPSLFWLYRHSRPCFHHSNGFGFGHQAFSREKIEKAADAHSLQYVRSGIKKDKSTGRAVYVETCCVIPSYVLNRYWPKFKRFRQASLSTFVDLLRAASRYEYQITDLLDWSSPYTITHNLGNGTAVIYPIEFIDEYAGLLAFQAKHEMTALEVHQLMVRLSHILQREKVKDITIYAWYYHRVWIEFYNMINNRHYSELNACEGVDMFYMYDNIGQYVDNWLTKIYNAKNWLGIGYKLPVIPGIVLMAMPYHLIRDPNSYTKRKYETDKMEFWFNIYKKNREISNYGLDSLLN